MKKLFTVTLISLFAIAGTAQDKFTVPFPDDFQKYQMASVELNGSYLIQISYAKSLGKSVEDVAVYVGDQYIATWNKQGGFDRFVQKILYMMVTMVPYGSVEITDQTDNKIIYKVSGLYSDLREGGSILDVTYEEYIKFWEVAISRMADSMGAKYSQEDSDEGLIVTITRQAAK
jgi:hypothetical protein